MDWRDALSAMDCLPWIYMPILILYVFFMYFAVLNVVIGAFVAATAEIKSKDKEALVKTEMIRFERYTQKIKGFFHEADTDRSGKLSLKEFERHLENDQVRAYFQALELDVTQARALFKVLDTD